MSDDSESLDLSARDLMPNWVTDLEKPPAQRRDKKPAADRPPKSRPNQKSDRGRQGYFGDDRSAGGGGGKGRGGGRPPGRYGGGGGQDARDRDRDRPPRGKGGDFKGKGRGHHKGGGDRDRGFDRNRSERQEDPLPNVEAVVEPTPEAVEALAKHIRGTGRAYALADVAKMVMQARDRYRLVFRQRKCGAGNRKIKEEKVAEATERVQFFRCKGDGSLWLSQEEAVSHVLRSPVMKQFYTVEDIEVDPPKGSFSVIAICGMSGKILGPPNHHEYQTNLARLYRERFSGMSFERYKSRIEMHRDEETLEKWKALVGRKRIYRVGPAPEEEEEAGPDVESDGDSDGEEPASVETDGAEGTPGEEVAEGADTDVSEETETDTGEAADDSKELESSEESAAEGDTGEVDSEAAEESVEPDEPEAEAAGEEADSGTGTDAEAVDEEGSDEDPEDPEDAAPEGTETESAAGEILESEEALARHFRENYAAEAIKTTSRAVVAGDVQGRDLSGPLLEKLKAEVDKLKRGFPLPMIQQLCRAFEKKGLRFFKRGKKTLYVSVIRPRPIANEEAFTDRIRGIVTFVREHPRARVMQLLDALVPDYQPPPGGESFEEHHLTQSEHDVLADLRWLTMEGYVIEFPNSELLLGGRDSSGESDASGAPKTKSSQAGQSKKRARKRNRNRNKPRPNPLKAGNANPGPAAPEKPVEKAEPDSGTNREMEGQPSSPETDEVSEPEAGATREAAVELDAGQETGTSDALADNEATSAPSADETPVEIGSGLDTDSEEPPSQETSVTS